MAKNEVVVVSGVRTAVGGFGGSLKNHSPTQLGALVIEEAVKRAGLDTTAIGHVVMGNVLHTEPADMYLSRVAALNAGLDKATPALTVNRLCGSGLQAIVSAAQQIELGMCSAAVGGGAEVMSRGGYLSQGMRFGARMGNSEMIDMMVQALHCPIEKVHMGVTAENIAEKWGISREEQDALALESHKRAANAITNGYFKEQVLPVELKSRQGSTLFDTDEHVRREASIEDMSKLSPAFKKGGTVTAGNASGINDGAAAIVMMSAAEAEAKGMKPMAKLLGYAYAGVDPKYMGIGPVPASKQLLDQFDLSVGDIDIWEANEAFAAQALAVCKDLDIEAEKINPNGSGVGLGHPIGATGAIITVKALYELQRIKGRYAVVTMCIGGGQGIAALFERV